MTIDENIGKKHNQIISEFLQKNRKINILNYGERQNLITSYFKDLNNVDASVLLSSFDRYLINDNSNFNPFEYLNSQKGKLSEHLFNKINSVITETSNIDDVLTLKKIISKYRNEVSKDNGFLTYEKETFVNTLYVYESSIDLWYNYNSNTQNSAFRIKSKHYWQIATCDFIGGISGGLAGAHVGFLIGVASASLQAAVCFWE